MFKLSKMIIIAMFLNILLYGANNIDIGVTKNIDNPSIVTMTPRPIEDVLPNTKIEIVFNQALDSKHIKKNDIKVQSLSNPSEKIEGEIEYDETSMKLSFVPSKELEEGIYEVSYQSLKLEANNEPLEEIKYRFTVSNQDNAQNYSLEKPIIALNGPKEFQLLQGEEYKEYGVATYNATSQETIGSVDTSTVGSYTITYVATNKATKEQSSISRTVHVVSPYGVDIDTNIRKANATLFLSLRSQPTDNVTIEVVFDNPNEAKVISSNPITFTPDNWQQQQSIFIEGLNPDSEGRQEYNISFKPIVSQDSNYDGVQLPTIEKKSPAIVLEAPQNIGYYIAEVEKTITFKVDYNTFANKLSYKLLQAPKGMRFVSGYNAPTGYPIIYPHKEKERITKYLSFEASRDMEGKTYPVIIEVTDGLTTKYLEFNVSVAPSRILQSEFDGEYLTIIDESTNLNGVKIKFANINNSNLPTLRIVDAKYLIVSSYLQEIRISDYLFIEKSTFKDMELLAPLSMFQHYRKNVIGYSVYFANDIGWLPDGLGELITQNDESYILMKSNPVPTKGMIIGTIPIPKNVQLNSELTNKKQSRNRTISSISPSEVICISHPVDGFALQLCHINRTDLNNTRYIVQGFGNQNTKFLFWDNNTTSIETMLTWFGEAKLAMNDLGGMGNLQFLDRIIIEPINRLMGLTGNNRMAGVYYPDSRRLYIDSEIQFIQEVKMTAIHEYFHYGQHATSDGDVSKKNFLASTVNNTLDANDTRWLAESTAKWFEDYLYDNENIYPSFFRIHETNRRVLENGLTSTDTVYKGSFLIKLLSSKCNGFTDNMSQLFYANFNNDSKAIKNFIATLENTSCNLPNFLDMDNFTHAMLYYQYATTLQNDIALLDDNEVGFQFVEAISIPQDKWQIIADYFANDLNGYSQVADYGAHSFILPNVKDLNSSIQITAKTDKPLTIVGVHLDENNQATPAGIDNNFFFHTKANEPIKFKINKEEITGGFFITLLNPTDEDITLLDLNISKRFIKINDNNKTLVADNYTSLLWEDTTETLSWTNANNYCNELFAYQYSNWRLPTFNELKSIINLDSPKHVYDEFEDLSNKPYGYWSSHVFLGEDGMVLNYKHLSYSIWDINKYPMNVICVRNFVE